MTRKELSKITLPETPGVYFFRDSDGKILYIGKAASLRDRARSYFSGDLALARSPAIAAMVEKAASIKWQETGSVLEALILEANLIKKEQPPYNAISKDNKSFNYLVITKERFPRVLIVRGRELFQGRKAANTGLRSPYFGNMRHPHVFGPFPHGLQFKEAVKIVRKIFPFRDSRCTPCEDQLRVKSSSTKVRPLEYRGLTFVKCKPCFNRQIGLCPGVCSGEVSRREYARIIRHIKILFSGKIKTLKRTLEKEMRAEAKAEHYEKAQELRRQISALEHIRDVSLIKSDEMIDLRNQSLSIEAYDVAHTSGTETVAVMTVVRNGEPIKDAYRKFKIRTAANDDIAALKEVLSRRLVHSEWPLPRIFVVDGGKGQVHGAEKVLSGAGVVLPVVGVVKDEFHRPVRLIGDARIIGAHEKDILLANVEAHRFAIKWHRRRRESIAIK